MGTYSPRAERVISDKDKVVNRDQLKFLLDSIEEELFGTISNSDPYMQKELWALVANNLLEKGDDSWGKRTELIDHFVQIGPNFLRLLKKENKSEAISRKFRQFCSNQISPINRRLLSTFFPDSSETPLKRLACNAYIEVGKQRIRLVVNYELISKALEREIDRSEKRSNLKEKGEELNKLRGNALGELNEFIASSNLRSDDAQVEPPPGHFRPESILDNYLNPLKGYLNRKLNYDPQYQDSIHYQDRTLKIAKSFHICAEDTVPQQEKPWTIEDLFEEKDRIIIVGETGVGKTTLLHKFAQLYAEEKLIPIYIDLSKPIEEGLNEFINKIRNDARSYPKIEPEDQIDLGIKLIENDLNNHNFVFLFDHLDQARPLNEDRIPKVVVTLNSFINHRQDNHDKFVICCRANFDSYYTSISGPFTTVTLERFEEDEAVLRLLKANGIERLHEDDEKNSRLLELGRNPHNLKMLIALKKEGGNLDISREVEIYEQFVELHTRNERDIGTIGRAIKIGQVRKSTLGYFAFQMMESDNPSEYSREDAEAYLESIILEIARDAALNLTLKSEDIKEAIDEILAQGLIVLTSDRSNFRFMHDSLREFFCAWHFAQDKEQALRIIGEKVGDSERTVSPEWDKIIVFYAGLVDDATSLVEMIRNEYYDDIFCRKLCLAGKCVAETRYIDNQINGKVIDEMLNRYWDKDYYHTWEIKGILILIKDDRVVDEIVSQLDNRNAQELFSDFLFLREFGSHKAAKVLIEKLEDKNQYVRSFAALVLSNSNLNKAIYPMMKRLEDEYCSVRESAATFLGNIGFKKAVKPLIEKLKDEDRNVRMAVAEALGNIGIGEAIIPLIEKLEDKNLNMVVQAAKALVKIGPDRAIEIMIEKLKNGDSRIKIDAAYALGKIGSERAVEPLIERLKDENEGVRSATAYALGKIGSERAVEPLVEQLEDENEKVRGRIVFCLRHICSDRVVDALIKRLEDEDRKIREWTVDSLKEIGSERAIEPLIERLKDENEGVRSATARALGNIGSERAVEPLIEKLKDENEGVRSATADVLGEIGSERAVEPLIKRLEDDSYEVQRITAYALGKIGSERAVEPLIEKLKDENEGVRSATADVLGKIGSERAVEALTRNLEEEDQLIINEVVEALGEAGSNKAVEILCKTYSRYPEKNRMIFEALYKISAKTGIKITKEMVEAYKKEDPS